SLHTECIAKADKQSSLCRTAWAVAATSCSANTVPPPAVASMLPSSPNDQVGRRRVVQPVAKCQDPTNNEPILACWPHAEQLYRRADGGPTKEIIDFKHSLRPHCEFSGHTLAREFGPLTLKAVRQKIIEANLCRGVINQRIGRIKRLFRWAVEN